jgi:hypothetical protein
MVTSNHKFACCSLHQQTIAQTTATTVYIRSIARNSKKPAYTIYTSFSRKYNLYPLQGQIAKMMIANTNVVARRSAVAAPRSATPVLPRRLVVRKFKVGLLLQLTEHQLMFQQLACFWCRTGVTSLPY